MSPWILVAAGVVVGFVLALMLRRKSVQQTDQSGGTQYIRPHVVAAAPVVSPEVERLDQMQAAGTISQVEYDLLRSKLLNPGDGSGAGLCTLTIIAGTSNKIHDIKAIRSVVHLDLKDAKDVVDRVSEGTAQVIARDLPRSGVERMQQILSQAGLQVRIN